MRGFGGRLSGFERISAKLKSKVRSAKCEVRSAKCEVGSGKCEVGSGKCEVQSRAIVYPALCTEWVSGSESEARRLDWGEELRYIFGCVGGDMASTGVERWWQRVEVPDYLVKQLGKKRNCER